MLQNLMECHFNMATDFNCVRSIVNLKMVHDIFATQLFRTKVKPAKEVRLIERVDFDLIAFLFISVSQTKGFFFSALGPQKQVPVLYQWFKLYYLVLTNKVSSLDQPKILTVWPHFFLTAQPLHARLIRPNNTQGEARRNGCEDGLVQSTGKHRDQDECISHGNHCEHVGIHLVQRHKL